MSERLKFGWCVAAVCGSLGVAVGWFLARSVPGRVMKTEAESSAAAPRNSEVLESVSASTNDRRELPEYAAPSQLDQRSEQSDALQVTDTILEVGSNPAPPSGTHRVRVRRPDGSVVEVELQEMAAKDESEYPPQGSVLEGTLLTVFHGNGLIAEVGEYVGGKKFGHWSCFSEDGQLLTEGEYEAGLATGFWRAWHDNGRLRSEAWTELGEFHGECQFWKADGSFDAERSGVYERGVLRSGS